MACVVDCESSHSVPPWNTMALAALPLRSAIDHIRFADTPLNERQPTQTVGGKGQQRATAFLQQACTQDGLVGTEVGSIVDDAALGSAYADRRARLHGSRSLERRTVLDDKLIVCRIHGTQVSVSPVLVAQGAHLHRTAADDGGTRVGVFVGDGEHARASLHEGSVTRKDAISVEGVGVQVACQGHCEPLCRIVEDDLIARDEDVSFAFYVLEILDIRIVPCAVFVTSPIDSGGFADVLYVEIEFSILPAECGLLAVEALYLDI